ncbi:MAG: sucrase ferredoxin [Nocardioidaceae bacterium]|nr:sucrase ferredoxin [Nocardioidaceae bacterium]MCL2614694.1 sucrase ferredoxin [Nocardioidaceae bacterium]
MPSAGARGAAGGVGALSDFRCAVASESRDEDLAGSASVVRAFVLLEHPGPWGVDAVRDARMASDTGRRLARAAADAKVRLLLVRRPGRRATDHTGEHRVFAVQARPPYTWAETTTVADPLELLDLDLAGLRAGRSPGLERHDDPVLAVCAHGRHDACCAERGRPVAAALASAYPEQTWEISHLGGDRFAANMLLAPDGLYYGRLDEESAVAVADARMRGELELDHLRGRTGYGMPVQAADVALRRRLADRTLTGPRLLERTVERTVDGEVTTATFAHGGRRYAVRVRTTSGEPTALTCRATRANPPLRHEVLDVAELPAGRGRTSGPVAESTYRRRGTA